ncbi:site-specific integrase [Flammeovirgaceae bacterium SG7u.111]|nr:site-specific integrase [Flammeovirgaceae bacterium SG7u.132]WPO33922.1 site-specific integrase [Flammeovirgaceae bacterium SG7u.111]
MKQLTIKFFLHKTTYSKKTKDFKLYFRVCYDRDVWACATDHRLKKKDFNEVMQLCKSNELVNEEMMWVKNRVYEIKREIAYQGKIVTLNMIKESFKGGSSKITLVTYLEQHLLFLKKSKQHSKGTVTNWFVRGEKLKKYLVERGKQNTVLHEIEVKFIQDFDDWLSCQISEQYNRPYARSYINEHHKRLKSLINKAINEEIISHNPYKKWNMPSDNREVAIKYLTNDELTRLYYADLGGNKALEKVRDIFVFSAMTGLRYSDAASLKVSEIHYDKEEKLYFIFKKKQQKTKGLVTIPLLHWAEKIYLKYKNSGSAEITGKLLPIYSNPKVNAYLKTIADLAGIEMALTHHVARHTCATFLLSNSVPLEQVSEILGHKNLSTTRIYAKITKQSLSETAKMINKKLGDM